MAALVVFVVDVGVLASGVVLDSIGGGLLASSCTGICVTSSHKFQVFVGVIMEVVGVVFFIDFYKTLIKISSKNDPKRSKMIKNDSK